MKLTKKEFEALHLIEFMNYNNPELLSKEMKISNEEAENILYSLRNKILITIEERENEIYGSQLTNLGKEIWNSPEWEEYKIELGY